MKFDYQIGDESVSIRIRKGSAADRLMIDVRGETHDVEVISGSGGEWVFRVDGHVVRACAARNNARRLVQIFGQPAVEFLTAEAPAQERRLQDSGDDVLTATMPSQVVGVEVAVGDTVSYGDTLVVLEAMKMEMRVTAPHDGRVASLACSVGDLVEPGFVLLTLERVEG